MPVRFEILDSWRGICALLVAIMHFPSSGPISESLLVRHSYFFVDYFFVLSGFVLTHGFGTKLHSALGYLRFVITRFGRVYPLHIVILGFFVGFELLRLSVPALQGNGEAPFTGGNSPSNLLLNLFLLNGVGLGSGPTWNVPSWSISAEFWTYLIFGSAVVLLRQRYWIMMAPAIIAGPIILYLFSPNHMDTTWDFGFIRCIYGFALGSLLYRFACPTILEMRQSAHKPEPGALLLGTLGEVIAVTITVLFVTNAANETISFGAPFVFAGAVFVFSIERGAISHLLRNRLFLWLGGLSYGIYMVHIFVQARMINVATLLERFTGIELVGPFTIGDQPFYGFGTAGPLFGTVVLLVMILMVVLVAFAAHILVERPCQLASKRLSARLARAMDKPRPLKVDLSEVGATLD